MFRAQVTPTMELLSVACVCLLMTSAAASDVRLEVKEGSDVVLPCYVSGEDLTGVVFDWKRDEKKEVFLYDGGRESNSQRHQDEQVKGRVFHFRDELKNGNASIKITDTKVSDSGTYTCDFPRLQPIRRSTVELVVGACPKPSVTILNKIDDGILLHCEVFGASPKPELQWQNSSGNKLPAAEPQVTQREGRYDVILQTTVTKTDNYSCVATQDTICHKTEAQIHVPLNGPPEPPIGWIVLSAVLGLLFIGAIIWNCYREKKSKQKAKSPYS